MRGNNTYIDIGMFSVFSLKSKFLLYHVAYYQQQKLEKYSQKSLATRSEEHTHFLAKN